jgi:nucleotide-binding universal stress UspA family protein
MIPDIKKILYATDLSENSAFAFRYAINSAKKHDANIIILHVFDKMPGMRYTEESLSLYDEPLEKLIEESAAKARDRIRKRLKIFCDKELKGDRECAERV